MAESRRRDVGRLFGASFISASGAVLADVAARGLLVLVVARTSGAAGLGAFSFALAITTPLFLLFGVQLSAVVATDTTRRFRLADVMLARSATTVLAGLSAMAVALVVATTPGTLNVVFWITVLRAIDGMGEGAQSLCHRQQQLHYVALSQVLRAGGGVLIGAILLYQGVALTFMIMSQAAVSLAILLMFDLPVAVRLDRAASGADGDRLERAGVSESLCRARELVSLGLPLGLVSFADAFMMSAPRLALERATGAHAVGLLSGMLLPVTLGGALATALSFSSRARMAELLDGREWEFRRLAIRVPSAMLLLGLAMLVAAVAAGPMLLPLVLGNDFVVGRTSIALVALAGAAWYVATGLGVAVTAARRFERSLMAIGSASAVTVVGSFVLAPIAGLDGVASALVAGMMVRVTLMHRFQPVPLMGT